MHVWPHVYMYVLRMYDTYIHTYIHVSYANLGCSC